MTETTTETTETPTETPETAPEAAEATEAAAPEVPGMIGKLTPEEQTALLQIRQQSQQLLAKVGEHEVLKMRVLAKLDELDAQGQEHINAISKRLGLEDGQTWVALQDGTIRMVNSQPGG